MAQFITVTLNPALDLTGQLDTLVPGEVNRVQQGYLQPAGKGVNGAQVLADLGEQVTVSGLLGEDNAAPFHALCEQRAFADHFVSVAGSTRINVKLAEASSQVTDLNFPGFTADDHNIAAIASQLQQLCNADTYVILAGSLPKGVAADAYVPLIEAANQQGATVLFDSSGPAFAAGLAAKPALIKPNREELAELVGHDLSSDEALGAAVQPLLANGIQHVVVSDGANGLYWFTHSTCVHAQPPRVQVLSTVGAGDSLVAGLAYGLAHYDDPQQILKVATALSAQAVTQVGVGISDRQQFTSLQQQVQLTLRPELVSEGAR